ncbi:ATP/GTP-binding protein [Kitasatospora sp. NPDC058201]|uniref:GTP-binding protein n=1 Tax=unclassified Kitasatospora TaxID=2633591 RepID=UPI0036582972
MKLVVAGPFGVGKTTLIRTLSEIPTLHTEEAMTETGAPVDDVAGLTGKSTTTVAVDFGRLTLPGQVVLYMFGTPGQRRFFPLWQDIARGAVGALVLADTRRLADSFEIMDMVEEQGLPYAVAVNCFPDAPVHPPDVLRAHLDLHASTPLVLCDARERDSGLDALIALTEHVLHGLPAGHDPAGSDPAGSDPDASDPAGPDPAGPDPAGSDPAVPDPAPEQP